MTRDFVFLRPLGLRLKILLERREGLDKIAEALLEHETLDLADVDHLLAGGSITRPPPPKAPPPSADKGEKEKAKKGGILGGLGGVPKAEPGKA